MRTTFSEQRNEMLRLSKVRPSLLEQTAQLVESVAEQIVKQLGGMSRIQAMIGKTVFQQDDTSLSMKFANKAAGKPNYVLITLDPDDTYTLTFKRGRGINYKTTSKVSGAHAEDLRGIFEANTGLYLKL